MQSMSDDDAAYSALLAQLLSDSATSRNARVHSWIEHQYDFVLSEPDSRPPSPSPSSSVGVHRTQPVDRPDSPLLPRVSSDRPSSPCPSYDALFFPKSDEHAFEEQERVRALRFIVQEMAHWKSHANPSSPEKPLPAPPPSPASSIAHSTSSRAMRSRSSSTRISRLPSFTSTLSDQSQPQEIPPPLPVSVIVHGEYQHDLVLSRDRPLIAGYLHKRDDSKDSQLLCTVPDDLDSALQPSPTFSSFSCAHSRNTSLTTPVTSPTSAIFCPENVTLPSSPVEEADACGALQRLRAPKVLEHSQSRWSLATTASMALSTSDTKSSAFVNARLSPQKSKTLKTPRKRARLLSLISRLSPGRNDPMSTTSTLATDDAEYDSPMDSDSDDKDKNKSRKSLSKKSSLASLRASFSMSRASFSSQRPPISSPIEEIPPLPTSPTLSSPLADVAVSLELASPPKQTLSKIPSRVNGINASLPPIPKPASTVTSFHSSQVSISDTSAESPASRSTTANVSSVSLLPAPSKRTSLASAAGIEPMVPPHPVSTAQPAVRSKSIFRLTARPKSLKVPPPGTRSAAPSKLPLAGTTLLPSPTSARSRIPQAPAKFNPPTKLATVIATQSRPALGPISPTTKLPMPPSRIPPKVARPAIVSEKLSAESFASSTSTRLPMPASTKGARVGTVKGFWKRQ